MYIKHVDIEVTKDCEENYRIKCKIGGVDLDRERSVLSSEDLLNGLEGLLGERDLLYDDFNDGCHTKDKTIISLNFLGEPTDKEKKIFREVRDFYQNIQQDLLEQYNQDVTDFHNEHPDLAERKRVRYNRIKNSTPDRSW